MAGRPVPLRRRRRHGDHRAAPSRSCARSPRIAIARAASGRGSCRPELVVPTTIHPAFDKAAHYFGVKLVKVPVGPDFRADVRAMAKAIALAARSGSSRRRRSIRTAWSIRSPSSARSRSSSKLPLHVDACVGGFVLPWLERLGRPVPRWDFRVPGRDVDQRRPPQVRLRRARARRCWCGARSTRCATRSSSRPTSRAASTRRRRCSARGPAARSRRRGPRCTSLGEDGYLALAQQAARRRRPAPRSASRRSPGSRCSARGDATIVSVRGASAADVYAIADRMEARGWTIDRQQRPASIHLTVTANHAQIVDEYLADLARVGRRGPQRPVAREERQRADVRDGGKMPVRGLVATQGPQGDRGHVRAGSAVVKRIAFARIAQETNALSPVPTTLARLREQPLPRGRRAAARSRPRGPRSPGFFKRAELGGLHRSAARARKAEIEPVPLLSAWASSGGPLTQGVLRDARGAAASSGCARRGPLDGMYFCLHGAMGVHGVARSREPAAAERARGDRRRAARRLARSARQRHARARRGGRRDRRVPDQPAPRSREDRREGRRDRDRHRARRAQADDGVAHAADDPRRRQDDRLPRADARRCSGACGAPSGRARRSRRRR